METANYMTRNSQNNKVYIKLWNYLLIISSITLLITLGFNRSSNLVENISLLPLAHCIYLFLAKKTYRKQPGLALLIMQIIIVCRYLVIPLLYAFLNEYTGILVDPSKMNAAVWYMFYELVAVGAVMRLWSSVSHRDQPSNLSVFEEKNYVRPFTLSIIVFWFFIITINEKLRGYLFNFSLLTREEMGFTQYISLAEYQSDIPGIFKVFFYIGLIVLFTTIVQFIAKRNWLKVFKVIFLLIICVGFISCMWSRGGSVSRWGMLIATILSVYVLMYAFPNRKKTILIMGIAAVVPLVLLGSMLKTISFGEKNVSASSTIEKYFSIEYFDEYFEGIAPVANGIVMAERFSSARGVEGILIDCLYNFPYAMKILGLSDGIIATDYFHQVTGHYDLIMPTVTESIMQFGGFLAPLYSCILVWLALWFDRKQQASRTLYRKLFYTVLVFWTSLFMAISTNDIEANIWYAVIGIWLMAIEEKFRFRIGSEKFFE